MLLDYVVIAIGLLLVIGFYAWAFRGHLNYTESLGTAFVIIFIVLLLAAAVSFSYNDYNLANQLSEYAYFSILIGVILEAISLRGKPGDEQT
jgi:hypothetical protein